MRAGQLGSGYELMIEEVSTANPSTVEGALASLTTSRLVAMARIFGCEVHVSIGTRDALARMLAGALRPHFPALLRELGRDELRAICRKFSLDGRSPDRSTLQARILESAGMNPERYSAPPPTALDGLPTKGQIVHARHRQWLVDAVSEGEVGESARVRLVCLDDDAPGRELEVLWDLELGARVVEPSVQGLGVIQGVDAPTHFGAYLHALKWSAVSAADAARFQAPFRAGIKLMAHQLTPLMKALELPRANLFIADDVGLGKTIEAGLVLQELLLRQQADFVLIVAPSSVCLQWQGEMQRRFGLRFEVMSRQFVMYRRQDRGFGTNPWSTHNRFIVSHALLRRAEYREPLLQHLGDRARKGLLILDEAHAAAPASASKYAVDTDITRTIRDLAPRFDNRLFLSATPHNGHSNSFSALLEILDPVRFTRGVKIDDAKALEPVMVRRLKRDLRKIGGESFPRRLLVENSITHEEGRWRLVARTYDSETERDESVVQRDLGPAEPYELELATKLAKYTALCAPAAGQARLPFINLQQRLLSSPEAFARTLEAHAKGLAKSGKLAELDSDPSAHVSSTRKRSQLELGADPEAHGVDDEVLADESDAAVRQASEALEAPSEEAARLLREMRQRAERARWVPDAKMRTLFAWLREHLCAAIGVATPEKSQRSWTPRRVILFTEYADTKRYVLSLLEAALEHTDGGMDRVLQFHGGMGDEARAEVQAAFNSEPTDHPVRILVATDAAREGVNLQGFCADLVHLDIPWNPGRMEQRNGRIDRTLQSAESVRCQYFLYPQRSEDVVLRTVVRKIETIQRELGSLGAVLLDSVEKVLAPGIDAKSSAAVERITSGKGRSVVETELESSREEKRLRAEIDRASRRMEASRRALEVNPDALRSVVNVGFSLSGAAALSPAGKTKDGRPTFALPALDRSWAKVLDTVRPPRARDEDFYAWRQRPPKPVTFHPLANLTEDAEQLHLAHPIVKRILDRFLAQGFGAHDLSRVSAVIAADSSVIRAVGFARLTLFGKGAARLHDEVISLAAPWSLEGGTVVPYKDRATAAQAVLSVEALLAGDARVPNATVRRRVQANAPQVFADLWPHLEVEADARATDAKRGLGERARRESDELRSLLKKQADTIVKADASLRQAELFQFDEGEEKRQVELDLRHMANRLASIERELETEPQAIEALYEVTRVRLLPVGLVVAWPEAMA